ncbi:hypothetical protein KA005_03620 [bacterium]|nr:hypothetical protein [bacterium]
MPWTIGQTVTDGGLVSLSSGQLIPHVAGLAGALAVGVIRHAVTTASDEYTTQGNVEVEVPVEMNVEWIVDVDTTHDLVLTDIGSFFDLSSESGYTNNTVDGGESDEDIFQCVGFISATKGIFVLNIGLGADTESDAGA